MLSSRLANRRLLLLVVIHFGWLRTGMKRFGFQMKPGNYHPTLSTRACCTDQLASGVFSKAIVWSGERLQASNLRAVYHGPGDGYR